MPRYVCDKDDADREPGACVANEGRAGSPPGPLPLWPTNGDGAGALPADAKSCSARAAASRALVGPVDELLLSPLLPTRPLAVEVEAGGGTNREEEEAVYADDDG